MWDAVLIFIAVVTALVMWLRWNYNHWTAKGIPQVEPTIIFGNMKELLLNSTNMAIVSQKIYNAFPDAPAIGYYRMRSPVLQIKDPALIKAVLVSEFQKFRDNGKSISKEVDPIFGRNPFLQTGDEWRETRRIQTHQHSAMKLKNLFGFVGEVKDELIEFIKNNLDRTYDAHDLCSKFTTDIVSSCVFGIKIRSHADEDSEFKEYSHKLIDVKWKLYIWLLWPSLFNTLRISLVSEDCKDYFYNLVQELVELRRKNNYTRADFLQNLLSEKNENLSVMDMTAQTMTFFIDGYATSATEMSFLLYMLATHPDVQDRLREEINNAEKLDFETLHSLPYMDAVFNETLRLYPAGVSLTRQCNEDATLTSKTRKFEFKVGDSVEIPVYAIHRDPNHFPEPLKFDPNRFLEEPNHPLFLAFGAGPRACLGSRFAKTQIKAGVAHLVKNFSIIPGTDDHSLPTIEKNDGILMSPDKEMSVKFELI